MNDEDEFLYRLNFQAAQSRWLAAQSRWSSDWWRPDEDGGVEPYETCDDSDDGDTPVARRLDADGIDEAIQGLAEEQRALYAGRLQEVREEIADLEGRLAEQRDSRDALLAQCESKECELREEAVRNLADELAAIEERRWQKEKEVEEAAERVMELERKLQDERRRVSDMKERVQAERHLIANWTNGLKIKAEALRAEREKFDKDEREHREWRSRQLQRMMEMEEQIERRERDLEARRQCLDGPHDDFTFETDGRGLEL